MLENYLQESRRIELEILGSKNVSELIERSPEKGLYKKGKNGTISRDYSTYFDPEKIHLFYLDLVEAIPESDFCDTDTTILRESKSSIQHNLVSGGSAEVGILHEAHLRDDTSVVKRGYARILYQTIEGEPVSEAYILCDINGGIFSRTRSELRIEQTDPDAPLEIMRKSGYLDRVEVTLSSLKN